MSETEKMRILVVDDDPLVLRVVGKQLTRQSFVVDTAESAEEALKLLCIHAYQAVVTDYEMNGKTGVWLLEKLRVLAPGTCRILHSGSDLTDLETHIESGVVQCYLSKPAPQIGPFLSSQLAPVPKPVSRPATYSEAYHKWVRA